jgi:hypothetical protein
MTPKRNGKDERMFIIELKSKKSVKTVCMDRDDRLLIEGSIGSFRRARFLEDIILEVIGSNGELRIDLAISDFEHLTGSEASDAEMGR